MKTAYDAIVVGSGIAGLSFALKLAEQGYEVAIFTKKSRAESNTNYAQGGIACVTSSSDSFSAHIDDTLAAGAGQSTLEAVEAIVKEGPQRIEELKNLGVEFSQLSDGNPSLGKEGGHSKRRVLHVKDRTGQAIESALIQAVASHKNITVEEHFFVVDLITTQKLNAEDPTNRVLGVYALDVHKSEVKVFSANAILLATGGVGQVYRYTTNPSIATGDGIAMAARAGVPIKDMEFIQFHPTALYTKTDERFLISEAVRGEGAILRNSQGVAFMKDYHPLADLAPRDVVARAIDEQMKQSGSRHVWLDFTSKDENFLKTRFPNIFEACAKHSVFMHQDWIPVVPAAHYLCGGIAVDLENKTCIDGLYACGEAACTGLHGANRLASNSLLEALVMAHRGAQSMGEYLKNSFQPQDLPTWIDGDLQDSDERVVISHNWSELRRIMWDYVGIVRTEKRLQRAQTRIQTLSREVDEYYWNFKVEPQLLELRNLIVVAKLIIEAAIARKESQGLHFLS